MKKIILSLVVIALLFSFIGVVKASSIYTQFVDQGIVFSPEKAYYPTVIYDGTQYLMLHDKSANYAVSNDGIT